MNGRPPSPRRVTRRVLLAFLVSLAGSVVFLVVYAGGGGPQHEGVALLAALGGLGVGLAIWSHGLMPQGPFTEERGDVSPPPEETDRTAADFTAGARRVGRRRLLGRLLALAAGTLGVATVWPVRSLGPRVGDALVTTAWGPGTRLVDAGGQPVRIDALKIGSVLTVFPEGHARAADAQTILLRLEPGSLRLAAGREDWSPRGHIAYSKVCTHAGCPVGLFASRVPVLLCPCHQATFDVLDAARPIFGPAPRPLPQLPLDVDDDGILVARGDFSAPVGPAWWGLGRG